MNNTLPEATLTDKKLIAEKVLDWIYNSVWDTFTKSIDKSPKSGLLSAHFDPSGIHFYEVIGKLEVDTKKQLELWISNYTAQRKMDNLYKIYWANENKAEIIQALLEILKEGN